jgi:hypothetical protein
VTFANAVGACLPLRDHYRAGLGALGGDRRRVTIEDTRRISGSVNVEQAQLQTSNEDHTWDYGVGIAAGTDDFAIWIEVHSADSLHVELVLYKLQSLIVLLRDHAPELNALPTRFVWLATGAVYISPNSNERRRLNSKGLLLRSKQLDLGSVL